jgi:C4-dicarboxylate transporter, DctQ subunit
MEAENKMGISFLFHTFGRAFDWFEVIILSLGVFILAALVIVNVFARTFFVSLYFVEELTEMLVILITFVGVSYGVRKARHIRMGAFFDIMPLKVQKGMILIICIVGAIIMFLMARYSYNYMDSARMLSHRTPALRLPYWTFLAIIPLGFFSAGIQYVRTVVKNLMVPEVWLSPEQQGEYEVEELQHIAEKYGDLAEEMVGEVKEDRMQPDDANQPPPSE